MEQSDEDQPNAVAKRSVSTDTSIADFVKILMEHNRWGKHNDRKGLPTRVYIALAHYLPEGFPNVRTLRDLDQFRDEGMIHNLGTMPNFGPQSGEYVNHVLQEYGIPPIPWRPHKLGYRRHQP